MLPIHVISLADAQDRRVRAQNEMARHDVDFRFFDAYDGERGKSLFDDFDERAWVLHTGREITPGEIGCYASHKSLWRRCADENRPLMIMEDDFKLAPGFADAVLAAGELVGALGFVRLQDECRAESRPVMEFRGFRVERYTKTPHCAMCYALSPELARRLVAQNAVCYAPVDVVLKLVWTFDNPMYCLTPYTVTGNCHSFDSMIGERSKCSKTLPVRIRRFLLKAGWHARRVAYNQSRSDEWIRQRFTPEGRDAAVAEVIGESQGTDISRAPRPRRAARP